jgi:hypothetical protein
MAHVSSQEGQFCFNIETAMVPAQENVHGEAEAEVVDARQHAVGLFDSSEVEEQVQSYPKGSSLNNLNHARKIWTKMKK